MFARFGLVARSRVALSTSLVACLAFSSGCATGGFSYATSVIGFPPFSFIAGSSGTDTTDTGGSSFFDTDAGGVVDPCAESNARKYIRISMRNLDTDDYIHYFLVLVAYINGDVHTDGAVCVDDIDLYTSFGYQEIPEGEDVEFGNLCIEGPALLYFHRNGQFRGSSSGGSSSLASAIGPAQGTSATYDTFFSSGGTSVPIPDRIYFHNPGTGEGAALQISWSNSSPCSDDGGDLLVDSECDQDSFYYVDDSDLITGSVFLGVGSGRRVPSEIQGTGCECQGFQQPYQVLAPSGTGSSGARCNEFLRGGRIEYAFVREDTNPAYPQLLWRVTDQTGSEVHDFDARGPIP